MILEDENKSSSNFIKEIIAEIKAAAEMSEQELKTRIAQFYTDINIDGRFLTIGDNHWGLEDGIQLNKLKKKLFLFKT